MNKVATILLFISMLFFSSCIVTNRQYLSLEKKINDNKTDTIIYKKFKIINKDVYADIYKKENNGKVVRVTRDDNKDIIEYSVCRYKDGIMKGTFRVYSNNNKLLRKIKIKKGKPTNIVSPGF